MLKLIIRVLASVFAAVYLLGGAQAQDKKWTEVRIATEGGFLPWNFTKPDGTLGGFEIDLANDLCARMKVKCVITAQSFDSMIPALNAGKYDALIDDVAITPKREEAIAFSIPYAALCYTLGTLKGSDISNKLPPEDKIYSLTDEASSGKALDAIKPVIKDKAIGTLSAGTSVTFVETYFSGVSLMRQYKTPEARDLDLVAGRVDLIIGSKDALLGIAKKAGNENITIAGPCFQGGVVGKGAGVGLRKADVELKALFDKAIREAQADGTIKRLSEATFGMDVTPQ
ncbi:MAG: transporter substrate-binding domain-containing protein [Proteobacteria bacterium]|nr:transporter substrate-binding domain-containing protein [Pseudomonadota bacterium]MBI3497610.1 transporter substrate-binding domain-containing protein [Pseudomonadota bacterium]